MFRLKCLIPIVILLVYPGVLSAQSPPMDWLYLDGGTSTVAVILCHGRGQDGDGYVVGPLREELHAELGYHTLALTLPGGHKPLSQLAGDFAQAGRLIGAAIAFLREERQVEDIIVIGHSLGSRMASAWLKDSQNDQRPEITGFVGVSMLNNGGPPFNCLENLRGLALPILDVAGSDNRFGDVDFAKERRVLLSSSYQQILIAGADHGFSEHDDELFAAVSSWLLGLRGPNK